MARLKPWKPASRLITGLLLLLQTTIAFGQDEPGAPTLNLSPVHPLYEYGSAAGDSSFEASISSKEIPNVNVQFYGKQYHTVYVSIHGHISFGEPPVEPRGEELPFSYPSIPDPPMAAVYFSSAEVKVKANDVGDARSMVYYRTLSASRDQAMLEELGREVRSNAITDMAAFNPTHALVVTWHNLRYVGCFQDSKTCPRNTFQAVLVADHKWTYAIYNYKDLTWLGGITELCDVSTGLGQNCFPAQVGFNAGQGRYFFHLPGSNSANVLDLSKIQGSRTEGRHIYRVSHYKMLREGCSTAIGVQALTVYPDVADMLGGTELYVSGPCLPDVSSRVTCVVGSQEVAGRVLDTGRAACPVPPVTPVGQVEVMIKLASSAQYLHKAKITIEAPRRMLMPVKLEDYHSKWLQRKPAGELTLTWDPARLNRNWLDVEQPENGTATPPGDGDLKVDKVNVMLMGYKELTAPDGQPQFEWKVLTVLANGVDNSGTFSFPPADHRCPLGKADCDFQLGVIKVEPTAPDGQTIFRALHSDMLPLGWFVDDAMTDKHGDDWPGVMCDAWKDKEAGLPEVDKDWGKDLEPCPCTEAQAYTDRARFIVGAECGDDPTAPCPLSPQAKVCYVSATPTGKGAETRCCYDKEGHLLYSADALGGSYPGRVHEAGVHPYLMAGRIPVLSHWLTDKLPYIWCCLWSADPDESCLARYEPHRRTPDCSRHHAPRTAFAFGDPHFLTFDGTQYTFNGYAEYWLLRVDGLPHDSHNVQLQARMQNSVGVIRDLKATVITAVALQQGKARSSRAPRVTFFLNPPLALQRVSVYVDDVYQDFYTATTRTYWGSLGSVTIHRNSEAMVSNNFTAMTDTGVSVIVAEKTGMLQVMATVPPSVFNHTAGLFGVWDNDPKNDLRTRDGKTIVDPANTEDVHKTFGVDWAVKESESVFTYFKGMPWRHFEKDKSFVPNFKPAFPNVTHNVTAGMVDQTCGGNLFCRFDYMTTLSEPIAQASLQAEAWAAQERDMAAEVAVCPYLEVPFSRRVEGAGYLVGGKVTLTGCVAGYTLIGPSDFTCQQDGDVARWSPPTPGTYCKADSLIAAERQKMAVAISVPITLLVVAALVVLVLFIVFKRRQKPVAEKQPADDLPRQQVPVTTDPNPMMRTSGTGGGSKTSLNSNASRSSIVLTEQLVAQRPPRPPKTKPPPESPANDHLAGPVYDLPDQHPPYPYRGPAGVNDPDPTNQPVDEPKQPAYPYKGPAGYDNPDASQIGPADQYTRPPYPYRGPSEGPHVYDNPDPGQLGPEDQYTTPVTRGPPEGRVKYGGPGHPRPQSTVSSYGAERTARRRDEDENSLDGTATYAQPRRPAQQGYDNQGYGQGRAGAPPKGPSSDTFV